MEKFILNNRFVVDPSHHSVKDKLMRYENHLEPRLMTLLCLLSGHAGRVLSREYIYQEIWNNYGGAEEGLTQAISILRKVLSDRDKKIIETVPKKGYILHAVVTPEIKLSSNRIRKILYHPVPFVVAACLAIALTITTIQLLLKGTNPPYADKSPELTVMADEPKASKLDRFVIAEGTEFSKSAERNKKESVQNGFEKRKSEIGELKNVSLKESSVKRKKIGKQKNASDKRSFTYYSKVEMLKILKKQDNEIGKEKRMEEKSGLETVSFEKRRAVKKG